MPNTYTINEDQSIITVTFTGNIGLDELRATALDITNNPAYKPHHNILNDLRTCVLTLTHDELTEFAQIFKERFASPTGKSAILMDSPHTTAIAMLHQQKTTEARRTELFTTHEAAMEWLNSD